MVFSVLILLEQSFSTRRFDLVLNGEFVVGEMFPPALVTKSILQLRFASDSESDHCLAQGISS